MQIAVTFVKGGRVQMLFGIGQRQSHHQAFVSPMLPYVDAI
jgi:hypothetical protein